LTINTGDEQVKEELKMGTLITLKIRKRNDCLATRIYRYFCLVLQGYDYFGYKYYGKQGNTYRRIHIG
jgi:hypothetical protein